MNAVAEREPRDLTARQREIYSLITQYTAVAGEPPSVCFIARRVGVHRTTVQFHLEAIHRKGWLPAPRPWLRSGVTDR